MARGSPTTATWLSLSTVPSPHTATAPAFPLQVQEWKLKCEAIEKRENERREVEAKKHKEEV